MTKPARVGLLLDIDEGARNQFCYVAQAATPTRLLRFGPASTEEKRRSNPGDLMTRLRLRRSGLWAAVKFARRYVLLGRERAFRPPTLGIA